MELDDLIFLGACSIYASPCFNASYEGAIKKAMKLWNIYCDKKRILEKEVDEEAK